MDKVYIVYLITNRLTGDRYIGKTGGRTTEQAMRRRFRAHWSNRLHKAKSAPSLASAMLYFGLDAFEIEIVHVCGAEDEAFAVEIQSIAELAPEYNRSVGGEGASGFPRRSKTQEERAVLSARFKGRIVSAETRSRLAAAQKGRKYPEESKAKMRAAKLGKTLSVTHRAKISESLRKRPPMSDETRQKIAVSRRGMKLTPESILRRTLTRFGQPPFQAGIG